MTAQQRPTLPGEPDAGPLACARSTCSAPVPVALVWRRSAGGRHCGWTCYFEDLYDQAERDAAAEGLTGRALRERAGVLYLDRSTTATPGRHGQRRRRRLAA